MNRFSTKYWLQNKPLSVQLWVFLTLFGALAMGLALGYLLLAVFPWWELTARQWRGLLFLFLMLLVLNLFLARRAALRIVAPLEKLSENMDRIKGKNWADPVLQTTREDEIGRVVNKLAQIQRNVVEINEDEEFFYQSVSHGLKTPIMVIQNCCAAYQDGIYGGEAIDIIMQESQVLESGIKAMLYVSSFDHILGRQSEFQQLTLQTLAAECCKRFQSNDRGIHLLTEVPEDCVVPGNAAALQTVLDNLVENAVRYAKSYIHIGVRDEKDGYLLTVENDGSQIPPAVMNTLFDKFYRGKGGNFGLGLYIARKIVLFHGGDIWAANWEGGVRFHVLLKK